MSFYLTVKGASMSMSVIERATIQHYHRHRMAEFGERSVQRLGWKGPESQERRFAVIAEAADFNGRSVLDLGCGCGDLKRCLDRRFAGFSYTGLDLMSGFILQAQEEFEGAADTWFFECDFSSVTLPAADIVVASGALSYRSQVKSFHLDFIPKMYESAREALIFNMLDAALFPEHPLLVGHDVDEVMAVCRSLTPGAELVRGYLEDDFTVVMRREGETRNDSPQRGGAAGRNSPPTNTHGSADSH